MFDDLAVMLRFYGTADQRAAAVSAYFDTLSKFPLDRVRRGYQALKESASKFPAPAQWIAAMPRESVSDLIVMSARHASEYDDAEKKFYEGDFCSCKECTDANATHLNLRYVPCLDASGATMPRQHPTKRTAVLVGEWIHGHRLKRWYSARAEFYRKLEATKPRVKDLLATTEPLV
jgi:hypothetical protein